MTLTKKQICVVVVTYNPNIAQIEQLTKTKSIFEHLIIVNNSPESLPMKDYELKNSNSSDITIFNNPDNLGIAQALNKGCTIAKEKGFEWIVTLDQDSNFEAKCLEQLIDFYNKEGDINLVSLSPKIINHGLDLNAEKDSKHEFKNIRTCITSGNLLKITAWKAIGGFKEFLFIDAVDTEFSLKLYENKFRLVQVNIAKMVHTIGDFGEIKIFGHSVYYDKHSPIRNYYITRNNIYLFKVFFLKYPLLCCYFIRESIFKNQLKMPFFEKSRLKQCKFILQGYFDGLIGKYGKYDWK